MSKDPKLITSSVNLPIDIINTLVNVDDRRLEVPISEMINDFEEKKIEFIRTMNTTVDVDIPSSLEYSKYIPSDYIQINHGVSYINSIEKRTINEVNMNLVKNALKFYKIEVEYGDGRVKELIVPSYVKFYSMHKGEFTPVEQLKNRDILYEIGDRMVKVSDAELVENYEIPKEYYNIKVTFERQFEDDEVKESPKYPNLYINGILVNVAYYNFNKSIEENTDATE